MIPRRSRRACRRCGGALETCQKRVCQPCLKALGLPPRQCRECRLPFYGATSAALCPVCLDRLTYLKRSVRRADARERAGLPFGRRALTSRTNVRPGHGPRYQQRTCFTCGAEFEGGPNADRCFPCASLRVALVNRLRRLGNSQRIAVADRIERVEGREGLQRALGLPVGDRRPRVRRPLSRVLPAGAARVTAAPGEH